MLIILLFIITYLWITGSADAKKVKAAETYNRYREVQRNATDFEIIMRKREAFKASILICNVYINSFVW